MPENQEARNPSLQEVARDYQDMAGEEFPWMGHSVVVGKQAGMDPSTEAGRQAIYERSFAASRFMEDAPFMSQASQKIEAAKASGRVFDVDDIERKMGEWGEELNEQRWLAESMKMLREPGAWEALPESSKEAVYKALGQERLPFSQTESIRMAAAPGRSDEEAAFMQLLTPMDAEDIQRPAKYRANTARSVMKSHGGNILESASRHGVDPLLMAVQIAQESGGDSQAVSHADAVGLTQFISSTWNGVMPENQIPRAVGDERHDKGGFVLGGPKDPRTNPSLSIEAQARYLGGLIDKHGGNVAAAVSEYNAGPWSLRRALAGTREFPTETRNYYPSILAAYEILSQERGELLSQAEPRGGR